MDGTVLIVTCSSLKTFFFSLRTSTLAKSRFVASIQKEISVRSSIKESLGLLKGILMQILTQG